MEHSGTAQHRCLCGKKTRLHSLGVSAEFFPGLTLFKIGCPSSVLLGNDASIWDPFGFSEHTDTLS